MRILPRTIFYMLALMLIVVAAAHGLMYWLLPGTYAARQQRALADEAAALGDELAALESSERFRRVADFAARWNADVAVEYQGYSYRAELFPGDEDARANAGPMTASVITEILPEGARVSLGEGAFGASDYFSLARDFPDGAGSVSVLASRRHIEDAGDAMLALIPYSALCCAGISALFAVLYAARLTSPLRRIGSATRDMRALDPNARCPAVGSGEIAALAADVNILYDTLRSSLASLEAEKEKAAAADAQKIQMLRAASHELKTPITAVSLMLENMILGVGRYRDHDRYLAKCKELMDRMAETVREILDASGFGGADLPATSFAVGEVARGLMESHRISVKAAGLDLREEYGEDIRVFLPRGAVEKVLSNLIGNAVAYTKPGGRIILRCRDRELSVLNECVPIPPDHLEHIFEPFYRPDYGRARASGGNGLGLCIVKSVLASLELPYAFEPASEFEGMVFRVRF